MKSARKWIVLMFALALGFQQNYAGKVLGTTGQTCYPINFRNLDPTPSISVYGDKIESIDRATTGVSGLRVMIVGKYNGQQNNSGPYAGKGRVDLIFTITNATPGKATISLINDPDSGQREETFTFTISIIPPPTVTRVVSPTPADPFNNITVTLIGTGLHGIYGLAAGTIIKNDNLIPFITMGGDAEIRSVRVIGANTNLEAQIEFTAPIQDATVELTLQSNNVCVPLGVRPKPPTAFVPFKTRVRVRRSDVKNYVRGIAFPHGNTFDKGSNGRIVFNLLFPAPQGGGSTIDDANRTVYFKLVPAHAFTAAPNGTPYNVAGFTQVIANAGSSIIPISFRVADCLGGQLGTTNTVKIQTWMHNTNSTLAPEFVEQTFQVRCTQ